MRRILLSWAVAVGLLLAGSSAVGLVVKAVVRPERFNYSTAAMAPAVGGPSPVRDDLIDRPGPTFGAAETPPADAAEFAAFLDTLVTANRWSGPGYSFSTTRTAEELAYLKVYSALGRQPTNKSIQADAETFRVAIDRLAARQPGPLKWDSATVISAARTPKGPAANVEARVVVRHIVTTPDGPRTEYRRWWFQYIWFSQRGVGQWMAYDFDEPGTRLRYTTANAGVTGTGPPPAAPAAATPAYAGMIRINDDADDEGVVAIREVFKRTAGPTPPAGLPAALWDARRWHMLPCLAAVRTAGEGRVKAQAGDAAAALADFDAALKTWPDTPAAHLGRAIALNKLKRFPDALKAVAAYRAEVGDDPEAVREFAHATDGTGDRPAAVAALAAGLKDFPTDFPLMAEYVRLAGPKAADMGERAAGLPKPADALEQLLLALPATDAAGADAVVKGYRNIRRNEARGRVFDAAGRVRSGEPAAAAAMLQAALLDLDADGREAALRGFARVLVRAGKAAEAYAAADAAAQAWLGFKEIATAALDTGPTDGLRAAADARAKADPNDAYPHYARGVLCERAKEYAAAAAFYAAAAAKLDKFPDLGERVRPALAKCHYLAGTWEAGYAGPADTAADRLDIIATLAADAADAKTLKALVAAHEKARPDAPELAVWKAELAWQNKDYPGVLVALARHVPAADAQAANDRADDRRTRALVRLGRAAEAEEWVGNLTPTAAGRKTRAVVMAANKAAPGTRQAVAECLARGDTLADLYADPDLGPLLKTAPELESVRAEFPPPK